MPHALLLSPDDQAVSAITGVLSEMSVSCERPLDAVSAAKKLNSHSFELVLVDCESLPAAKLIFDVCRRAKAGTNPVPIAIVDGRAGLPTAFRLGAELILTKPVAKDQARSTIRTAVNRLRKEEPARPAQPIETASAEVAAPPENRAQAAAAVSSGPAKTVEVTPQAPPAGLAVGKMNAAAEKIEAAQSTPKPASEPTPSSESFAAPAFSAHPGPALPLKASDDPVLAELEKEETEPQAPMFASSEQPQKKGRGPLVALLFLLLASGGLYAAWMYQPAFRTMVEPQIERALALVGMPSLHPSVDSPRQAPTPSSVKAPTVPTPANASLPSSAPSLDSAQSATSDRTPTPAGSSPHVERETGAISAAALAVAGVTGPAATTDSRKNFAAAAPVGSELPGEKYAVMLSSRGAENRLILRAQPAYPEEARSERAEGTVVLKTVVSESGKVEGVRLVEGNPILATAAISAVKQWRYRPYVREGKALPFQTIVLVEFQRP